MTRDDKIMKLLIIKLDALDELKRLKKQAYNKEAKKLINKLINDICYELERLHYELIHY